MHKMTKEAVILIIAGLVLILSGCSDTQDQKSGKISYTLQPLPHAPEHNSTDDNNTDNGEEDGKEDTIPEEEINSTKKAVAQHIPTDWYIRIVAESSSHTMRSSSAQLGELDESDAASLHTLKAFPPYGSNYLDVVFRDPEGVVSGDYKSTFHTHADNTRQVWRFVVRSSDVNVTIRLGWRGIYILTPYRDTKERLRYREYRSLHNPLMYRMKLVDTVTGEVIAAVVDDIPQYYLFNMDGVNERIFEWVVEAERETAKEKSKVNGIPKKEKIEHTLIERKIQPSQKKQTFDLLHPPRGNGYR